MQWQLISPGRSVRKCLIWVWVLSILWSVTALPAVVFAADGSLDATFGIAGIVTTDIAGRDNCGFDLAVQDDGKILVAGYASNGANNDIAVLRYNSDGSLDTTFDTDGIVTTDVNGGNDRGNAIAIQDDSKILVAGFARIGANNDIVLLRYNSNGSLDNTFGAAGIVTTNVDNGSDFGEDLAIQSDGKIVVAGYGLHGATYDAVLLRYNPNGNLDNTFGAGGIVTTGVAPVNDFIFAVSIQSDGKILAAGFSQLVANNQVVLLRYNSNGSPDNTFGAAGIVTTDVGGANAYIYGLSIQSDGRILVAGYVFNGANNDILLLRYNSDGSLDMTFGTAGIVITDIAFANDIGEDITIQSDGRVLVAGYSLNGTDYDVALLRYNPDGSLHTGFDADGIVTTDVAADFDYIYSVILQSDDKIVVAGHTATPSVNDVLLLRYENTIPVADGGSGDSGSSGCFITVTSGRSGSAFVLEKVNSHPTAAELISVFLMFVLLGGLIRQVLNQKGASA